jgi:ferritin-like protein
MSNLGFHEPVEELSAETRSIHRAILTVMEELEAVDWYQQRADAATDTELKKILEHNRDEEIEHASMALEWLRRNVPKFDEQLRIYLFTDASIVEVEEAHESGDGGDASAFGDRDLGIRNGKEGE